MRGSVRIIEPEILDDTPPARAAGSVRDLERINRYLGGHEVLRRTLARVLRPGESFTMLDVGAASGDMGAVVHRRYPAARVTSLDYRIHHLAGASPPRVAGNAFTLPFRERSFDLVYCSLFLHHFPFRDVARLLHAFGAVARRFVVVSDLERHWIPRLALPATRWLFRWDPITLHDGPISVSAGFHAGELEHLAAVAGLECIDIRTHRPAFRISLVARPRSAGSAPDRRTSTPATT